MLPSELRRVVTDNTVELLELASKYSENEFGDKTYTFDTPTASAVLVIEHGRPICISIYVANQTDPVSTAELEQCEVIRTFKEKGWCYIEFIGQLTTHVDGNIHKSMKAGCRLTLSPIVSLHLFFSKESWN
jgi:hypothetical protein